MVFRELIGKSSSTEETTGNFSKVHRVRYFGLGKVLSPSSASLRYLTGNVVLESFLSYFRRSTPVVNLHSKLRCTEVRRDELPKLGFYTLLLDGEPLLSVAGRGFSARKIRCSRGTAVMKRIRQTNVYYLLREDGRDIDWKYTGVPERISSILKLPEVVVSGNSANFTGKIIYLVLPRVYFTDNLDLLVPLRSKHGLYYPSKLLGDLLC